MNVAMIGAGRIGFPIGVAMASKGHKVTFYDKDQHKLLRYRAGVLPPNERRLPELYEATRHNLGYARTVEEAVADATIVFIAVQTPHPPEMDGSQRLHGAKANFDNSFVAEALNTVGAIPRAFDPDRRIVVVISTMLPGSMDELAEDWPAERGRLVYSPTMVQMGEVVGSFLNQDLWLIGVGQGDKVCTGLAEFYRTLNSNTPTRFMSYSSAEATKVFHNAWMTMKMTLANTMMEMAHEIPDCDVDDISSALACAHRLGPQTQARGGMVFGGPCFPRDNVALSWLADRLGLSYDFFGGLMEIREQQVEALARLIDEHVGYAEDVVLLGEGFKAGTGLTCGSPTHLLANTLKEVQELTPIIYDAYSSDEFPPPCEVYVLTVNDPAYLAFPFPDCCTIIDPWGLMETAPPTCTLVSVGRKRGAV
jgi:UDPglucose 6-dehydrogenase